jgi:hypothetical protein
MISRVPRDEVTNCTFDGDDLKTLFVTAGWPQATWHSPSPETRKLVSDPPEEVVQLLKIGYATIYEDASPSRREGREVRAGRGSM